MYTEHVISFFTVHGITVLIELWQESYAEIFQAHLWSLCYLQSHWNGMVHKALRTRLTQKCQEIKTFFTHMKMTPTTVQVKF